MKYDSLFIGLSPCTVLRLSGPDRLRYLNGQVTNDVRHASPTRAIYSAVLNPKGQLDAVCFIREHEDSYLLDAPLELRESLFARLDRYIIADDVELTDESDRWHLVHRAFRREDQSGADPVPGLNYEADRFGAGLGEDYLFADAQEAMKGTKTRISPEQMTELRIELGVPAWGAELTPGLLPAEAGLDATAISFEKGCYLGQEVVSRMKRAGKTNRHLVQLELSAEVPCPAALLAPEGIAAGLVTSVATTREGQTLALGFRTRKFEKNESFEVAGPDGQVSGVQAKVLKRLS